MTNVDVVRVVDREGVQATTRLDEPVEGLENHVVLTLEDGQTLVVSRDLLQAQPSGDYHLPLTFASLGEGLLQHGLADNMEMVIPVIEEEIEVTRQDVERRRVRIAKSVHEREVIVDQPLTQEHVDVNRVVVNRMIDPADEAPAVRYEGDTIIMPVLEEVVVVDIRLMLREEVHVTRRRVETHEPQRVTLRREEVSVETIKSNEPDDVEAATDSASDSLNSR
jgi:uncharacterized protein (TIGR02271 family)